MLAIQLSQSRTGFCPGDPIEGTVQWQLTKAPRTAELRLCWYTRGEGGEESEIVATQKFDSPSPSEQRAFRFVAPAEPYSFAGHLISLAWVLELVVEPGDEFERVEIVVGPEGRCVELGSDLASNI
jgi:hypothetical protein